SEMNVGVERNLNQRCSVEASRVLSQGVGAPDGEAARGRALAAPPHLARRSLRSLRVVGARGTRGSRTTRSPVPPATLRPSLADHFPWHFLNFLPDPHQHGSLRPGNLLGGDPEAGRPLPLVRVVVDVPPPPVWVVCVFSSCSACSAVLTVTRRMVWATPLAIRVSISSKKP